MKVLVTGSSGFIGSHVVATLAAAGNEVIALDRAEPASKPGRFFICDILDFESLRKVFDETRPEAVVHLAARADLAPGATVEDYETNTRGVQNVLTAVAGTPTIRRAIYTSTQLVCVAGHKPRGDEDYNPPN